MNAPDKSGEKPIESNAFEETLQHNIERADTRSDPPITDLTDSRVEQTADFDVDESDAGVTRVFHSDGGSSSDGGTANAAVPGYQILGELGRGAMGVVYRAKQLRADRIVALKVMLNIDHARPQDVERFEVEAQASARLQHVGIVQVFDVGQAQNVPYFTQEFVSGGPLSNRIAKQLLSHAETARIILAISKAVAYAHSRGIIHRDLKPSNILMAEDGTPKIADFGLARRMEDQSHLTKDGSILGTPSYMAPEQAYGSTNEIGPLSDVYALGAILYELLAGRTPFKGATVWEVIEKVRRVEPSPPSELQSGIPRDLETICLKCLQKDPAKRYGSAQLLADDIQRYINNEPILARPVGRWERLVRLCKRHPGEARLVGLVAALLLTASIGAIWTAVRINADRRRIEAEKKVADERLSLVKKTVSAVVNQLNHSLDSVPHASSTKAELAKLAGQVLADQSSDAGNDPAVIQSRKRGLLAVAIRKAEQALDARPPALDDAKTQILQAKELAESDYQQSFGDRAKAAGNLAMVHLLRAKWLAGAGILNQADKQREFRMLAIELRKEAASLDNAEDPKPMRLAMLGREYQNMAEWLRDTAFATPAEEQSSLLNEGMQFARESVVTLQSAMQDLPEDHLEYPAVKRDLALAGLMLGSLGGLAQDPAAVKSGFELAIQCYSSLTKFSPERVAFHVGLVNASKAYGDTLLVDNPKEAAQHYQVLVSELRWLLNEGDVTLGIWGPGEWAMGYYRLGLTAAAQNLDAEREEYFERCGLIQEIYLRQMTDLPKFKEQPDLLLPERVGLMLTKAWAGQTQNASAEAKRILKMYEAGKTDVVSPMFLAQCSFSLAICAQFAPAAEKAGLQKAALSALDTAIKAGFADKGYLLGDPDVAPMRKIEGFADRISKL